MRAGWIAAAVAVPALLLGVFVLGGQEDAATSAARAGAATDPATQRDADVAAAPAASAGSAPVAASASLSAPASPPAAAAVASGIAPVATLASRAPATAPPDPRVPPIDPPSANEPPPAQPWEVADPALYRAREQRLQREVDDRFVQATAARLPQLRAAVDDMRARGAAQSDIDRAEDKIRHMQTVQDALLRGEPLAPPASAVVPGAAPASQP